MDLFLFDVDGVLVESLGYLRALQDTVAHFSRQMGVGDHPPTEEEVRDFEANGLTSEWDSAPACVGALLVERLRCGPSFPLPGHWPDALAALAACPYPLSRPNYGFLARRVGARLDGSASPAQAVRAVLWDEIQAARSLGAFGASLHALLETLLDQTHDFYHAPVTRHFQHLAIGSQAIAETYGVAPDFDSPAYLHRFDRPLLHPEVRDSLKEAIAGGLIRAALYTTRPSRPPANYGERLPGYSPEAEMARSLVGLEPCPIIGRGRMRWLARQVGEGVEALVKPSPVQALAAIGAARSGEEAAALEAAWELHCNGRLRLPLAGLDSVTVHVFEDSSGGLEAAARAVTALQAESVPIAFQPYGIAPARSSKAAALSAWDIPVYPTVNEAALAALSRL